MVAQIAMGRILPSVGIAVVVVIVISVAAVAVVVIVVRKSSKVPVTKVVTIAEPVAELASAITSHMGSAEPVAELASAITSHMGSEVAAEMARPKAAPHTAAAESATHMAATTTTETATHVAAAATTETATHVTAAATTETATVSSPTTTTSSSSSSAAARKRVSGQSPGESGSGSQNEQDLPQHCTTPSDATASIRLKT
jgi:hypothetical protein